MYTIDQIWECINDQICFNYITNYVKFVKKFVQIFEVNSLLINDNTKYQQVRAVAINRHANACCKKKKIKDSMLSETKHTNLVRTFQQSCSVHVTFWCIIFISFSIHSKGNQVATLTPEKVKELEEKTHCKYLCFVVKWSLFDHGESFICQV